MLLVDVRDLNRGPVETQGQLAPDDPAFADLDVTLEGPVSVSGKLSRTGDHEYFWHARLRGSFRGSCRRCLTDVIYPLDANVEALFSANPENADDPAVYTLAA